MFSKLEKWHQNEYIIIIIKERPDLTRAGYFRFVQFWQAQRHLAKQTLLSDSDIHHILLSDSDTHHILLSDSDTHHILLSDSDIHHILLSDSDIHHILLSYSDIHHILTAHQHHSRKTNHPFTREYPPTRRHFWTQYSLNIHSLILLQLETVIYLQEEAIISSTAGIFKQRSPRTCRLKQKFLSRVS